MGLDIVAFRKITPVRVRPSFDDESGFEENLTSFYIIDDFRPAADDVREGWWYRYEERSGFRAGSYSGYNEWRRWLAKLVGTTPEKVWADPKPMPFLELINFADNEGTIGSKTAAKLARDFAEHELSAQATGESYYYELYARWRKAFEMAADGGAVKFL